MSRLTINSNIPSLNAQRSLGTATKLLGDSYTRLSSGLRINKASDDAAGLSVSESLKADTRLFNQGVRNLNDGVSLLNIADGALNELSNITIRLRELATQSANGTFSDKQRQALDQEAQSLSKEYNRIARSTEFNGRKIFNGDFGSLSLAAGGGSSSLIESGLGGGIGDGTFAGVASVALTGGSSSNTIVTADLNGDGVLDIVSTDYNLNRVWLSLGTGDGSFKAVSSILLNTLGAPVSIVAEDLNNDSKIDLVVGSRNGNLLSVMFGNGDATFNGIVNYNVSAGVTSVNAADINGDGIKDLVSTIYSLNSVSIMYGNSNGTFRAETTMLVGGNETSGVKTQDFNGDGLVDLAVTIVNEASISIFFGNGDGSFKARSSYGTNYANNIGVADFNNDGVLDLVTDGNSATVLIGNSNGSFRASVNYNTGGNINSISVGDINGDGVADLGLSQTFSPRILTLIGNGDGSFKSYNIVSGNLSSSVELADLNNDGVLDIASTGVTSLQSYLGNSNDGVSALQSFSLKNKWDAREAMSYLEGELARISEQRGQIGAFQSRLDVATSTLRTGALNYQEANSRITDIDVAEESSRLAAAQILQRSAASILAQANQQPQLVLKLLRDL